MCWWALPPSGECDEVPRSAARQPVPQEASHHTDDGLFRGGAVSVCKDSITRKAEKKPKASVSQGLGLTNICVDINYLEANDKEISNLSKKLGRVYAIPLGSGIAIRDDNVTMIGDSAKIAIFEKGTKITALTSLKRSFSF